MKLKSAILIISSILLSAASSPLMAQADSATGKIHFAYARLYLPNMETEYVSSVFCWTYKAPKQDKAYPQDTLEKWTKATFKDKLPKGKWKEFSCQFEVDSTHFYTTEQAVKYWKQELKECADQNLDVIVITFPDCKE